MSAVSGVDWIPVEVDDPGILAQVFRLRVAAWRARMPAFPDLERWVDDFDAVGRHWVVVEDGAVIAAARLTIHGRLAEVPNAEIYRGVLPDDMPGPLGVFNRLVVAPDHAGRRLSQALDRVRVEAARRAGCRVLIGETFAGLSRINQLEAAGFEVVGDAGPYRSGPLQAVKNGAARRRAVMIHRLLSPACQDA